MGLVYVAESAEDVVDGVLGAAAEVDGCTTDGLVWVVNAHDDHPPSAPLMELANVVSTASLYIVCSFVAISYARREAMERPMKKTLRRINCLLSCKVVIYCSHLVDQHILFG